MFTLISFCVKAYQGSSFSITKRTVTEIFNLSIALCFSYSKAVKEQTIIKRIAVGITTVGDSE